MDGTDNMTAPERLISMRIRAASRDMDSLLFNLTDIANTLYVRANPNFDFNDPYNARLTTELAVYSEELTRRHKRATTK